MQVSGYVKMTTKKLILILFTLTFSFAHGQNPQVKKEIKVVSTFDYYYTKDGKLYLSREGRVKTDTLITEYNRDGTRLIPFQNPYLTFGKNILLDSIVFISKKNNITHQREYWSDTTLIDIYIHNFGDSIIQIKTSNNDTIQINKSFFHNGKLVKTHNQDFRNNYGKFNEVATYDKKTKSREISTRITTYYKDGLTDSIRVDNKKKLYKTLFFNSDKNEWYVKEKTKYHGRKIVVWKIFYHDSHKMYFTTKTTTEYNKVGQPIAETVYDKYLRHIEKKTTYNYEYY